MEELKTVKVATYQEVPRTTTVTETVMTAGVETIETVEIETGKLISMGSRTEKIDVISMGSCIEKIEILIATYENHEVRMKLKELTGVLRQLQVEIDIQQQCLLLSKFFGLLPGLKELAEVNIDLELIIAEIMALVSIFPAPQQPTAIIPAGKSEVIITETKSTVTKSTVTVTEEEWNIVVKSVRESMDEEAFNLFIRLMTLIINGADDEETVLEAITDLLLEIEYLQLLNIVEKLHIQLIRHSHIYSQIFKYLFDHLKESSSGKRFERKSITKIVTTVVRKIRTEYDIKATFTIPHYTIIVTSLTPEPKQPKPTTPEPKLPKPTTPEPKLPKPTTPEPKLPKPTTPEPKLPKPTTPEPKLPKPTTPIPYEPKPYIPIDENEVRKHAIKFLIIFYREWRTITSHETVFVDFVTIFKSIRTKITVVDSLIFDLIEKLFAATLTTKSTTVTVSAIHQIFHSLLSRKDMNIRRLVELLHHISIEIQHITTTETKHIQLYKNFLLYLIVTLRMPSYMEDKLAEMEFLELFIHQWFDVLSKLGVLVILPGEEVGFDVETEYRSLTEGIYKKSTDVIRIFNYLKQNFEIKVDEIRRLHSKRDVDIRSLQKEIETRFDGIKHFDVLFKGNEYAIEIFQLMKIVDATDQSYIKLIGSLPEEDVRLIRDQLEKLFIQEGIVFKPANTLY